MARYFYADPHFFHKNIIKYEHRPFNNVDHMNRVMLNRYNKIVCNQDVCLFLGDFAWGNKETITNLVSRMNGYKMLIMGNHDRHKSKKFWHDVCFQDVIKGSIIWDQYYIFSLEPVYMSPDMPYVNVHGHLHSQRREDPRYFNACVELNNYEPICFSHLQKLYSIEEE